jgi:hypothetical protein
MFNLPNDIFHQFHLFLTNEKKPYSFNDKDSDWRNLMNTSKYFSDMKRETILLFLPNSSSVSFLTNSTYRAFIESKLANKSKQLYLLLKDVDFSNVTSNLEIPCSVFSLKLENCTIENLADFHDIHLMRFTGCNFIKEISSDESTDTLIFIGCNVPNASLKGFKNIKNKTVEISSLVSNFFPTDLFEMTGTLTIRLTVINDLNDIKGKGNKELSLCIFNCPLHTINGISNKETFVVGNCSLSDSISNLHNIGTVVLQNLTQLTELNTSSFSNIERLSVHGCHRLSRLTLTMEIELEGTSNIESITIIGQFTVLCFVVPSSEVAKYTTHTKRLEVIYHDSTSIQEICTNVPHGAITEKGILANKSFHNLGNGIPPKGFLVLREVSSKGFKHSI